MKQKDVDDFEKYGLLDKTDSEPVPQGAAL
jgi:hypothetical protein